MITRIEPSGRSPLFDMKSGFYPEAVDTWLTNQLQYNLGVFSALPLSVVATKASLVAAGWKFYVVAQNRGRCYSRAKVITIPVHAIKNLKPDYLVWYVCHEMAHAIAGPTARHGKEFMYELKRICPIAAQYHELGYMPRAASATGIKKPFVVARENIKGAL